MSKDVLSEVRRILGENLFNTKITRNVRLSEAPSHGKSIFDFDRNANGAHDYFLLAQEFINNQK